MRRLLDKTKDVETPSQYEFDHILGILSPMITKFVARTHLEGVSEEDLRSLYAMKVHQVLRRGKYDRTKRPTVFFYLVFSNLNRDINRLVGVAQRQLLEEDAFDYAFMVDETENQGFDGLGVQRALVANVDQHPMDIAMERMSERHRQIMEIALKKLDQDDPVLVPLATDLFNSHF